MTTEVSRSHTYDASLEEVAKMLRSAEFRDLVSQAQGARECEVEITGDYPTETVVVHQEQEARELPAAAAKLIGDAVRITQTEVWSAPGSAALTIALAKMPAEIQGKITLTEAGGQTTETVDMTITAKIPLIGSKLEEMAAALMDGALLIEERTGREFLAR